MPKTNKEKGFVNKKVFANFLAGEFDAEPVEKKPAEKESPFKCSPEQLKHGLETLRSIIDPNPGSNYVNYVKGVAILNAWAPYVEEIINVRR